LPQKGKEVVENWEEELKFEWERKEKNKIAQEVDWIIDTGTTRTERPSITKLLRWCGTQRC
jgi:hypothetical protein